MVHEFKQKKKPTNSFHFVKKNVIFSTEKFKRKKNGKISWKQLKEFFKYKSEYFFLFTKPVKYPLHPLTGLHCVSAQLHIDWQSRPYEGKGQTSSQLCPVYPVSQAGREKKALKKISNLC